MSQEVMAVFSMIGTLLLMVAVFVAAYYVSKVVGKRYQNFAPSTKNGIEIIERKVIGKDQTLVTVRVANQIFLLSATPHHIEKLEELDATLFESLPEVQSNQALDFSSVWKSVLSKNKKAMEGERKDGNE